MIMFRLEEKIKHTLNLIMDTKEIKIVPPEGYEIDKENSTFECVKFKPIGKRWRDGNPFISGWCLGCTNVFGSRNQYEKPWKEGNLDVFATEKQAKSALAMAQISQIMANDERFGGAITDEEWLQDFDKYAITRASNIIIKGCYTINYKFLAFHTPKQRDLFLKENEDLVKDYLMID